jgi:glycolate oxidase
MMDREIIRAVEPALHVGYPMDAGAVLLIEVDGLREAVAEQAADVRDVCLAQGAREVREAEDAADRARLWAGRKGSISALGRLAPNYYVLDGVVPRTKLPQVLRKVYETCARHGFPVANVFHAGDGNLHPLVLYDARVPGEEERASALGGEILKMCVRYGGSITGEHGVGAEKAAYMADMFGPDDLETMQRVRCAFDDQQIFNPGKVFPTTRLCGEQPGPYQPHPAEVAGLAERW